MTGLSSTSISTPGTRTIRLPSPVTWLTMPSMKTSPWGACCTVRRRLPRSSRRPRDHRATSGLKWCRCSRRATITRMNGSCSGRMIASYLAFLRPAAPSAFGGRRLEGSMRADGSSRIATTTTSRSCSRSLACCRLPRRSLRKRVLMLRNPCGKGGRHENHHGVHQETRGADVLRPRVRHLVGRRPHRGRSCRIPGQNAQVETLMPWVILAFLVGPALGGPVLTGFVYGRAGLREFLSRLFKWRVAARWYTVRSYRPALDDRNTPCALTVFP